MNRAAPVSAASSRGRRRVLVAISSGLLVAVAAASGSQAQGPAQPPAAVPAPPGSAAPPLPGGAAGAPVPGAAVDLPSPGFRFGSSEVPIVGGNVASARERAVAEALKQAVDQAITDLAPDACAAQPKVIGQILGKARAYVRRYRSILEGESRPSRYAVKLEAEVDEPALRRTLDRGAAAPAVAAAPGAPSYFVVGAGAVEATDAIVRALVSGGVRAERAPSGGAWDQARAIDAAGRGGLGAVAFVNGAFTAEGQVRGAGVEAIACTLGLRVVAAPSGSAVGEDSQTSRAFAPRADDARKDCFARAAAAAVPHVLPQAAASHGAADLRTVVVDVEVSQAGAVQPLLKQLRGSGPISSVDLRRITPGRLEVWVRSRLTAPGLVALLARDGGGPVTLSGAEVAGDRVHVRASLREDAPAILPPGVLPAGAAVPGAPAAGASPGATGTAAKAEATP